MFSVRSLATLLILITQANVSANDDSEVTCTNIETETVLNFQNATSTSTLGMNDAGVLRFQNVGNYRAGDAVTSIDLVVTQAPNTTYDIKNLDNNKKNGYYGMINVHSQDGEGTFDFCFENSENQERMTLDAFFFSFYDMDGTNNSEGFESISLENDAFTDFYVTNSTELIKSENDGLVTFTASTKGVGEDNPDDPNNLTEQQQNRGVVLQIENTDCFRVKMSVACPPDSCNGGRNFLFAGKADQIVPTCAPTVSPTVSPTTASPTVSPTVSPTTASPTVSPSASPNTLNGGGAKTEPTNIPTLSPSGGGVKGDPHFKTWNGDRYDFHGICDLVLIQNLGFENGLGMDIHIRTKKVRQWSSVLSAVVRIGEDTFEVLAEKYEDKLWLNGISSGSSDMTISGYKINSRSVNKQQNEYIINLGIEEKITVYTWKSMVRVEVFEPTAKNFETSAGLMGSFKDSQWIARDGKRVFSDANKFGQEWQVLPNEPTFFHNAGDGPQAPSKCEIPSKTALRRRLIKSDVTIEEAEIACAGIVNTVDFDLCVFDVMASGDKEIAGAY